VLRELGFAVTPLAARVRYRTALLLPRTHMLLLVRADGADWIVDVGFGGEGLLLPVPFGAGEPARQFAWTYRVIEQGGPWVLQSLRDGSWEDLYAFTLEPQEQVDYELASWYTSTHPNSRFVQTLTAQLPTPEVRHVLRDRELTLDRGEAVTARTIASDEELLAVLAETFGLHVDPGTRLFSRSQRSA
jgi:N-hydroxyarylamine O-acetyltransferase